MPCTIRTTPYGYLVYRLRWSGLPGYESQEHTGIPDTREHRDQRREIERRAKLMSAEMEAGRFDYLSWFPNGAKADALRAKAETTTIRDYVTGTWLPRKQPPLVRLSTATTYAKHIRCHILPQFGDRRFAEVTVAELEDFRTLLTAEEAKGGKTLKLKSARDIVDSTLRAIYRDARKEGLASGDPFALLDWPRKIVPEPDPFTEVERDTLLDYFYRKDRFWYPLVCTQFFTGMRPSEAIGLRRTSLDVKNGKLSVVVSRSYGEDNAPKTVKSRRTLTLLPTVARALRDMPRPAIVRPDDFVFTTPQGHPVDLDRFVDQHWHRALSATSITARKFYATRHTFISCALERGTKIKWLADYCGTSVEMIEKHYGKWMQGDERQLALLAGEMGSPTSSADRDGVPILRVEPGKNGSSRVRSDRRKTRTKH